MPQGKFKGRKGFSMPEKDKKSHKNSSLKFKKGKGLSSKKKFLQEGKKLQIKLEKAINLRIEEEVKDLASNEASSLKILKRNENGIKKKKS